MRTTIRLDPDIEKAVDRLRRESDVGVSDAVNLLARRGLSVKPKRRKFKQRTAKLGIAIDVGNVAEALDLIEETGRS